MKVSKSILGITGEYYVAAELGKRNVYAQLTLGNQKRTDLIIFSEDSDTLLKIEVKCKQGPAWPNCKGINDNNSFIVFVDMEEIHDRQRPDFYILDRNDWNSVIQKARNEYLSKHPTRKVNIKNNVLIYIDEVNKQGKSYEGFTVEPKHIKEFKENWDKIIERFKCNNSTSF
ncbi:hypothetical protein [Tenuifilum osseticum]|uniref:hypothetical protein n=1 Tax=Tenuifilum osseticum TaxID=3374723 RepID=UPI0034E37DA6